MSTSAAGMWSSPSSLLPCCPFLSRRRRSAAYLQLRRYEEAIADANACLAKDPAYTKARVRRARGYFHLGEWSKAEQDAQEALSQDAGNAQAKKVLQDVASRRRGGGQVEAKQQETAYLPAPSAGKTRIQIIESSDDDDDEDEQEEEQQQQAAATRAKEVAASGERTQVTIEESDSDDEPEVAAEADQQRATPSHQESPAQAAEREKELGNAAMKAQRWLEAVEAYERSRRMDATFFPALSNLSLALTKLEKWDDVEQLVSSCLDQIGWQSMCHMPREELLRVLEHRVIDKKLVSGVPSSTNLLGILIKLLYRRGQARAARDDPDGARQDWGTIVRLEPTQAAARRGLESLQANQLSAPASSRSKERAPASAAAASSSAEPPSPSAAAAPLPPVSSPSPSSSSSPSSSPSAKAVPHGATTGSPASRTLSADALRSTAERALAAAGKSSLPAPPKTATELERVCIGFQSQPARLAAFADQLRPKRIPKLFKRRPLEADVVSCLAKAFADYRCDEEGHALHAGAVLEALATAQGFSMAKMMLASATIDSVNRVADAVTRFGDDGLASRLRRAYN